LYIIEKHLDELLLVKECLKGRQDSQKHLYDRFASKMLGICYRYAQSREEAEDFLQESFIMVFRKLSQYKGEGNLGAWIRKIVINTSLNGIKARHRFSDMTNAISIETVMDVTVLNMESNKELMELIHTLPTGCKTVFNLYAIEGYSHQEIGSMLGIEASTSRSQFMKARKMLMSKLNSGVNKENEKNG
jgi:RNA polymerase sigma factor (sigma-70 family)